MLLFREGNILDLASSIIEDEYQEEEQKLECDIEDLYEPIELVAFVKRNIQSLEDTSYTLEIGCGTGRSFKVFPITHAIEPCKNRYEIAFSNTNNVIVKQAVSECLPFEDSTFSSILCIGTFNQFRSDYESLIEINRKLKVGGVFIFDLWDDSCDLVFGRSIGKNNYRRILKEFGFDIVEIRTFKFFSSWRKEEVTRHGICVKKVRDFHYRYLKKPQVSKEYIRNFYPVRDKDLL